MARRKRGTCTKHDDDFGFVCKTCRDAWVETRDDIRARLDAAERENARLEGLYTSRAEACALYKGERDVAQAEVTRLESEANIESIKLDAQRSAGDALMKMLERATAQRDEATALLRRWVDWSPSYVNPIDDTRDFLRKVGAP